jgi:hypothetical protein
MTYYVDAQLGDDTASGDADHPFATIRAGLDRVRAGDTLTVRAGFYRERLGEVDLDGTPDAPILIQADPGVVVRPTTVAPAAECVDVDRDIWAIPAASGARILEADETCWTPIPVADPNGVHFDLARPVPTHPVDSLALVGDIVGSSWFDVSMQRIYVHPYGSIDHQVELLPSQKLSFRGRHFTVTGFAFDYFSTVQTYQTEGVVLEALTTCGSPVQICGSMDTYVADLFVEQVIKRGDTYEWHHAGEGQAFAITETSQATTVRGLVCRHSWNGASFGGDDTHVTRALLYGFPNHNCGIAGQHGIYRHIKAYQSQDSLFAQYGSGCTIQACEFERALVIGGGHTISGKAMTDLSILDCTIHGGSVNCSNDTTIRTSDRNYFITNYWDYRYQNVECQSLADVQQQFGLEQHSVWDNRMLPR